MSLIDKPFIQIDPNDIPRASLPVIATNPHTGKSISAYGIIDTGADECAFPAGFADIMGHSLQAGEPKEIRTGNGTTMAYSHTVTMNIDGYVLKNVLIDFLPNLHVVLLCVKSFLNDFVLKIDYPNQVFSLMNKKQT